MPYENRSYPAKLILFGEYSLLLGSRVLGLPLKQHFGSWGSEETFASILKEGYFDYLREHCAEFLEVDLISDIEDKKMFYNSTIKRGYGIGSSGALSAATYDYCKKTSLQDTQLLQQQLAIVESFFHGQSSGFDPLLSYLNEPILRTKSGTYEIPEVKASSIKDYHLYLLDSGSKRKVKGLVPLFTQMSTADPDTFAELVKINDDLVKNFLSAQNIEQEFNALSQFQLLHMEPMIIDELKSIWQNGLDSQDYFLKICGAGGGGYYMVYSKEPIDQLGAYQLEPVTLS